MYHFYPLSMPWSPAFSPMSPTVMPGYGFIVDGSLTGTKNPCNPWQVPPVQSWANSNACVLCLPALHNH